MVIVHIHVHMSHLRTNFLLVIYMNLNESLDHHHLIVILIHYEQG